MRNGYCTELAAGLWGGDSVASFSFRSHSFKVQRQCILLGRGLFGGINGCGTFTIFGINKALGRHRFTAKE